MRSMGLRGSWLSLVVAALLLGAAPAASAQGLGVHVSGYDNVVQPGQLVETSFQVRTRGLIRLPLPGVEVAFSLQGQALGTAQTGLDGQVRVDVPIPAQEGDYLVEAEVRSPFVSAATGNALLAARLPGARVVIVDLAGTIQQGQFRDLLLRDPAQVPPVPGAVEAVDDLARDALVFYLIGHDDYFMPDVHRWLAHWGFHRGVAAFSKEWVMLLWGPGYKAGIYQLLAQPLDVAAGFGNEQEDLDAALSIGAPFFAIRPADLPGATQTFPDWDALRAANRAGQVPALSWASALR